MAHCEAESLALRFLAGELEGPEQDRYASHLKDCQPCQELTQLGLSWADGLIFELAESAPPKRVLSRLERQVGGIRHRRWTSSWVALVAAGMLVAGFGFGRIWQGSAKPQPPVAAAPMVLAMTGFHQSARGQLVAWRSTRRIAVTIAHLPPPPKGKVYEVWHIGGAGAKAIGTLHWTNGRGYFVGQVTLRPLDEIVICAESPSWEGEWMGPVVLSASVPAS
ncbi:MAG: anti-sigma factor [Firmicutes bacterium]|nr:anti-sigma factor [Bacillota bacterium]